MGSRTGRDAMRAWVGSICLCLGFIVGGVAFVVRDWPWWVVTAVLLLVGLAAEATGGASEQATTSQHATEPLEHGHSRPG